MGWGRVRGGTERRMRPRPALALALLLLLSLPGAPLGARAEPLDLRDPRPRAVQVRLEVSPRERPAQRDVRWTEPLPARIEPDPSGRVRVVVPARVVEERLFAEEGAVPGSFEDFVWVFDPESGEVLSASLSGTLRRPMGPGFLRLRTDVDVEVALSTQGPVAFRPGRRVLGELLHEPCDTPEAPGCRRVDPEPFDPRTGAVYAVGLIRARSGPFGSASLCPLGEALFLERGAGSEPGAPPRPPAVAAGPPESATASADASR